VLKRYNAYFWNYVRIKVQVKSIFTLLGSSETYITFISKEVMMKSTTYSLPYAQKEMLFAVTMHFRVDSAISGALTERQITFCTGLRITS